MKELNGKVAVITGGAGGLGLALARRFRSAGMNVVLGDVEQSALDQAVRELGEGVVGRTCDVTTPSSVDTLRDAAVDAFGGVHVVCLNAGVAPIGLLRDTSLETWRWTLDVNLLGVVHGIRSFCPGLVRQGEGHVVCTASSSGLASTVAMGAYTASKHAVVGLGTTLHDELRDSGVGVSIACPGPFRTRIFESERNRPDALRPETEAAPEKLAARYRKMVDRARDPDFVADAIHDGILENRLFVLPSPELNEVIGERLDAIRDALP